MAIGAALVLWCLPFASLGTPWLMPAFATVALAVGALLAWRLAPTLREQLRPRGWDVALGLGSGVVMVALTYPAYRVAAAWVPALAPAVRDAYAVSLPDAPLALAVAWIVLVLTVEELLWRGGGVALLERRWSRWIVAPVALLAYAVVHLATGSWVVLLLALGCGSVWLALRLYTGRLVAPLLSHLLWSPFVLLIKPLEGG